MGTGNELQALADLLSGGGDVATMVIIYFIWKLHDRLRQVGFLLNQYFSEADRD